MMDFFKKKTKKIIDSNIYAPLKGKCIDISDVNDIGFSSKSMGDGVAIIPEEGILKAPCDGEITMLFRTNHALGILADNGMEILVHIGIDTVNLNGKGFYVLKKPHDRIKRGETIVKFDLDDLKKEYDMTTMFIVTNGINFSKNAVNRFVEYDTCILEGLNKNHETDKKIKQ